jgi:Spy/CpxP family protein refolding chaperone
MIGETEMDTPTKNAWQIRMAAVLIFVLGFAAGLLAMNGYRRWRPQPSRQDRFVKLLDSLQLNEDQKKQAQEVLSDTRAQLSSLRKESEPKIEEIRKRADERLQEILTPEQWQKFQQERDQSRRDRRGRENPH